MNTLFLVYSMWLILAILAIGCSLYFSIVKPIITRRDVLFLGIGVFLLVNSIGLGNSGREINEKLSNRVEGVSVFSSIINNKDSDKITDSKLYQYLLKTRTPHAKIIFAQGKHESNSYTSPLYKRANNIFGMGVPNSRATCGDEESGEYQTYKTWKLSVTDYIIYALSLGIDKLSDEEYLQFLGTGRYAKDPDYKAKITKMINSTDFKKLEN